MSDDRPSGSNPFEFLMGDMIRAMGSQGQDPFAMLAQFAQVATSDAQASANVDPARRIALENLYRVAVLQTDGLNFLPPTFTAAAIPLEVHNPTSFARDTLNDWRSYLESLLQAMTPPTGGLFPAQHDGEAGLPNEMFTMLSQFGSQLSPMLSGAQIGSLVGHFALDSMTGFEVVLPRGGHPRT
ncbi:MAG: zinc-dependent metalloprotease, partial [Acidimicrobiales bacterium]